MVSEEVVTGFESLFRRGVSRPSEGSGVLDGPIPRLNTHPVFLVGPFRIIIIVISTMMMIAIIIMFDSYSITNVWTRPDFRNV